MSIDSWTPLNESPDSLPNDVINLLVTAGKQKIPDTSITHKPTVAACTYMMKKDRSFWREQITHLSTDDVIALIRFFTVVEDVSDAWLAGAESPVIHLNKLLRQRGERLDKPLLQWIKANSNNQYLPNGPITL